MGLTGSTETVSGTPSDIRGLRAGLSGFLKNYGYGKGLFPGVVPDAASLEPFMQLFTQRNAANYAQAKESAGNLSGSGYGNILGTAMERSNVEQGAFLAELLERRRQQDQQTFLQALLGLSTSGVGPDTTVYKPGLLDSVAGAALGLAGGGVFNSLFGGGGGGKVSPTPAASTQSYMPGIRPITARY